MDVLEASAKDILEAYSVGRMLELDTSTDEKEAVDTAADDIVAVLVVLVVLVAVLVCHDERPFAQTHQASTCQELKTTSAPYRFAKRPILPALDGRSYPPGPFSPLPM